MFVALLACPCWSLEARAAGPDPVYELSITARYDDIRDEITGTERWRWRNISTVPITELQLHLYLNAFAHPRTTFMLESGGQLRGEGLSGEGWGWVEVRSLRLADGRDLKSVERFLAPEDGNPLDQTVAAYGLPEPLAPGESLELEVEFKARLPEIFARTGVAGDYVFAGQWFPKLGVFEDVGVAGRAEAGWNVHQFHANSEFYADFGHYDVTLDLPARYVGRVGATGELVCEEVRGDRVVARFVARNVHDFAWTADTDTLVIEERFEPGRDVPPELRQRLATLLGDRAEPTELPAVSLRLLLQPQHVAMKDRYFAAARAALASLGLRLGPYPYGTVTLVDPPPDGMGSGGMEYPTLVTLGTIDLDRISPRFGYGIAEVVTVHELAHQYWYGMVASNEVEASWIDEGFSSYFETKIIDDAYGSEWGPILGLKLDYWDFRRLSLLRPLSDPVSLPSWSFRSEGSYGLNSYDRPATVLAHLEGMAGPTPFARAVRACYERLRWRHPGTRDVEHCLTTELSVALPESFLGTFFEQALHSTHRLDFAVERLRNLRIEAGESGASPAGGFIRATADIVRRGEFRHPVEIDFRFEDGSVRRLAWNGEARWERFRFDGQERLVSVEIDPRLTLALEAERLNNSATSEPDRRPRWQLLTALAAGLGQLFQALTFFG